MAKTKSKFAVKIKNDLNKCWKVQLYSKNKNLYSLVKATILVPFQIYVSNTMNFEAKEITQNSSEILKVDWVADVHTDGVVWMWTCKSQVKQSLAVIGRKAETQQESTAVGEKALFLLRMCSLLLISQRNFR